MSLFARFKSDRGAYQPIKMSHDEDSSVGSENMLLGRRRNVKNYSPYKKKNSKVKGRSVSMPAEKQVSAVQTEPHCSCRRRCFDTFSNEQKLQIIARISECDDKNSQDSYLQSLIHYRGVQRHRSRVETEESTQKPKTYSYEYYVKVNGETKKVCKTAYINLHGVSKKRVERLQKLLVAGASPENQWGRSAGSQCNVIPSEFVEICFHVDLHN